MARRGSNGDMIICVRVDALRAALTSAGSRLAGVLCRREDLLQVDGPSRVGADGRAPFLQQSRYYSRMPRERKKHRRTARGRSGMLVEA